jgi:acyl-CoA synthetase (AMP-forming)/AMP-acid ligase II/acyl carrier protein
VPEALRADPVGLRDWLLDEGITVTFLPTGVAEGMIGLTWRGGGALRFLLTGGDALTRRPSRELGFTVVNNYGVSEASVVTTSGPVAPAGDGPPTIGRAIDGVDIRIVDDDLVPVPSGDAGELLIGGVSVARGYLHQPELTSQRFVEGPGGRCYRTGDRVRMRPDGQVEFLGRVDDQLSIRGFRVEPGEVAAALNSHPGVEASVSVALGASSAERRLVAYVVADGALRPDDRELDAHLADLLPEYMVPSTYVWLEELPLTAHGKIDRAALPDPVAPPAPELTGPAPETAVETAVVSVIAELLERADVATNQNFFLLGGHSMLGAQLIVRLADLFDTEISLRYLFDHPTPAELAAEVERQLATHEAVA